MSEVSKSGSHRQAIPTPEPQLAPVRTATASPSATPLPMPVPSLEERDQETGIGAVVAFIWDALTRIGIVIRAHLTCILIFWIVATLIAAVLMDLYMRKQCREDDEEEEEG